MTRPAPDRRRLLAPLVPAALAATATAARAQDAPWPSKPVTIVVPQAAGGANDTVARAFGARLSTAIGQPVVIENRAGAGGNVGTAQVARAAKDGYTLMLTAQSAQTINPWLYRNTGFDPVRDFEPVMSVATAPYLLVANPSFPASNLKELIAYAKSRPSRIDYECDESLTVGRFRVDSEAVATVAESGGAASSTAIRRAPLVLEVNGVRHPLLPPGFTIGRGSEADLRINDPGISRLHARVIVKQDGAGEVDVSVEDLGSTNGVIVNGQRVTNVALADGSRIEIGSTRMLVHSPVGS